MGTNYQVNPFGQGSTMPSGYPIADNLTTDSAQQALSARQGFELNAKLIGYKSIGLSSFTKIDTFIHSNGKWANQTPYKSIFVPVEGGKTYELTANDSNDIAYSVLTSDSHTTGETPAYSTGYSGVLTIAAEGEETIVMPSDAAFLYLLVVGGNSVDKMPSSFKMIVGSFIDDKIVNDLTTGGADKILSAEMGKVLNGKIGMSDEDILAHMPPSVPSWINQSFNNWMTEQATARCTLVPVEEGEKYMITGNTNHGTSFAVLGEGQPVVGETPNYVSPYAIPVLIGEGQIVEFKIPEGGKYIYISNIGPSGTDYAPSSFINVSKGRYVAKSRIPCLLDMGKPTNIIYSIDDFLMAHEYDQDNNLDNFKFSNDLGKTWVTKQNIWGVINNVFMFSDGTLFFAAKNNDQCKCYWTKDFETFSEATVLDQADEQGNRGTYTAPTGETRWGVIFGSSKHTYIDGVEHYLFGDYVISTPLPRLWYATCDENGVTVRCAFRFGTDKIDGVVIPARHYHGFVYNKYNGYCYALTGDHNDQECNVLRGKHDENHVWTWERLAYGVAYKIADLVFDEGNMYFSTDYTDSSLVDKKGLISCPISDINTNRFRYLFHASAAFMLEGSRSQNTPAAITSFVNDDFHGWRIIGTDYVGNSKVLIAKGDHNFVWVDNNAGKHLKFFLGPNNNGDVYVWWYEIGYNVGNDDWVRFSHRTTYNLTEAMRNSGATDFFDGWPGTPR